MVTDSVSGETSTEKLCSALFTTVKQVPLTLMLSPILRSPITAEAKIVILVPTRVLSIEMMAPNSSTMPVNIVQLSANSSQLSSMIRP